MNLETYPAVAAIASAYLSHNLVRPDQVEGIVSDIGNAVLALGQPVKSAEPEHVPAVDPRKSVKPDHLISLIDGKPYKMLKRHVGLHGLTPDQYRQRYNLPADYPMVAANYSERRRELAKSIGLGHHPGAARGRSAKAA